jgi:hypothetical protein
MIDEDILERRLRDDARRAIADDGFSSRVMAALPRRAPATLAWLQSLLVPGSALLGSALALLLAPEGASPLQGFSDLAHFRGLTPAAIGGLAIAGALLVSAVVLAADTE